LRDVAALLIVLLGLALVDSLNPSDCRPETGRRRRRRHRPRRDPQTPHEPTRPSTAPTPSPREREVLALVAEGRSNTAIARRLVVSDAAVAKHINSILTKLDLPPAADDHRRVLAVLAYLQG
jgi:DNA-binding NarL/FixJ family response regulator